MRQTNPGLENNGGSLPKIVSGYQHADKFIRLTWLEIKDKEVNISITTLYPNFSPNCTRT